MMGEHEKKRAVLHRAQERELKDVHNLIEKEKKLKIGGKASRGKESGDVKGSYMPKKVPHKEIQGGSLTNLYIPKLEKTHKSREKLMNTDVYKMGGKAETKVFRKGGKSMAKKKKRMQMGGMMSSNMQGGMPMSARYSRGGTVYESEMVGEHPTTKFHHYDYEDLMRGEEPMHKAKKGKHMKLAAGGVAKMRHEEATSKGMPIHSKNSKVKVF
jgi:hypothetical protein